MPDQIKAQIQYDDIKKVQKGKSYPESAKVFLQDLTARSKPFVEQVGTSAIKPPLDRHIALLSDSPLFYHANAIQRARILNKLQQCYGNAYVLRVVAGVQAKLKIGQPEDIYEQEANETRQSVKLLPYQISSLAQRQVELEEEELTESIQAKLMGNGKLRRKEKPELKELKQEEKERSQIQTKRVPEETPTVTASLENQIQFLKDQAQPLPESERAFFGPKFGRGFRNVHIHTDNQAQITAKSINTRAFTFGRNKADMYRHRRSDQSLDQTIRAQSEFSVAPCIGDKQAHINRGTSRPNQQLNTRDNSPSRKVIMRSPEHQIGNPHGSMIVARIHSHVVQWDQGEYPVKVQRKEGGETTAESTENLTQSNENFYRNLIMAINNYGKKGDMGGLPSFYSQHRLPGPWTKIEKNPLTRELLDWKSKANLIVVSNYESFKHAFIDVIAQKIFKEVPGLSAVELDVLTAIETALGIGLEALLGGIKGGSLMGNLLSLVLGIAVNHINEALAIKELEERIEKFSTLMRNSKEFKETILSNLYNLDTLFTYYLIWIERAVPEELGAFRIPYLPEQVSENEIKSAMASAFESEVKGISATEETKKIGRVGLFYFLQENGMRISNWGIDESLVGRAGPALIVDQDLFPVNRFIDPWITYENRPRRGDIVHIWVLPQGRRNVGIAAPSGVHRLVLRHSRSGSHAVFDVQSNKWLTGITRKEWYSGAP